MDTRSKSKPADKNSVFICHSIHIQKLTPEQRECPCFTTPRYKKPQDSNRLSELQRKQISGSLHKTFVVHRPYGLDA